MRLKNTEKSGDVVTVSPPKKKMTEADAHLPVNDTSFNAKCCENANWRKDINTTKGGLAPSKYILAPPPKYFWLFKIK